MKCAFVLLAIVILSPENLAKESEQPSLEIAAAHNQNLSITLRLSVVKLMNNGIEKNFTLAEIQNEFAKAREQSLNEFNETKIGNGSDLLDKYYIELKRGLDALNSSFFKTLKLFNKAISYYKNYIEMFMITNPPKEAHLETKNRALAEFEKKATINGNDLFDTFKQKLDKQLDFQFQWAFPGIDFNKNTNTSSSSIISNNNNNTATTLGNTTVANNSTEATTTEAAKEN